MMNIAEMGYFFDLESKKRISTIIDAILELASTLKDGENVTFLDAVQIASSKTGITLTEKETKEVYDIIAEASR